VRVAARRLPPDGLIARRSAIDETSAVPRARAAGARARGLLVP
jgi:hypothetical protein